MSALVRVDSLLAEKEAAISTLSERLLALSSFTAAAHALEASEKDRLGRQVRALEALIDSQNEELEKFKADIDVLTRGQLAERERRLLSAEVRKLEAYTQTVKTAETEIKVAMPETESDSERVRMRNNLTNFSDRLQKVLRFLKIEENFSRSGAETLLACDSQVSSSETTSDSPELPELQQVRIFFL